MILSSSLTHGGSTNYHFRLHEHKMDSLCGGKHKPLVVYLRRVMDYCPRDHFLDGPRGSGLRHSVGAELEKVEHEVSSLARLGLESGYYENAHMNVQMFMLSYDQKTIAIEVPIWLTSGELDGFRELFRTELSLSGHIDLLRVEDGKVWVWDFKPGAAKEKYATTQTYFYALMLSKRTGLPLSEFRCGYFDDKDVYVFDPSKVRFGEFVKGRE